MGSKKDLSRVLNDWFDNKLFEIHTHIPGKIVSYSATERKAKVQPLIKIRDNNNDVFQIDPIDNVPVIFEGTSKFKLIYPLEKDDGCLLLFSEVSLGNYLNGKGNIVDADDSNRFELTDCICIPGLWGLKNVPNPNILIEVGTDNSITIKSTTGKIKVESNGNITLDDGTEPFVLGTILETILTPLITAISSLVTAPPATPVIRGDLVGMQTAAATLLTTLSTMKSTLIKGK